jgi:hypothetical protein
MHPYNEIGGHKTFCTILSPCSGGRLAKMLTTINHWQKEEETHKTKRMEKPYNWKRLNLSLGDHGSLL